MLLRRCALVIAGLGGLALLVHVAGGGRARRHARAQSLRSSVGAAVAARGDELVALDAGPGGGRPASTSFEAPSTIRKRQVLIASPKPAPAPEKLTGKPAHGGDESVATAPASKNVTGKPARGSKGSAPAAPAANESASAVAKSAASAEKPEPTSEKPVNASEKPGLAAMWPGFAVKIGKAAGATVSWAGGTLRQAVGVLPAPADTDGVDATFTRVAGNASADHANLSKVRSVSGNATKNATDDANRTEHIGGFKVTGKPAHGGDESVPIAPASKSVTGKPAHGGNESVPIAPAANESASAVAKSAASAEKPEPTSEKPVNASEKPGLAVMWPGFAVEKPALFSENATKRTSAEVAAVKATGVAVAKVVGMAAGATVGWAGGTLSQAVGVLPAPADTEGVDATFTRVAGNASADGANLSKARSAAGNATENATDDANRTEDVGGFKANRTAANSTHRVVEATAPTTTAAPAFLRNPSSLYCWLLARANSSEVELVRRSYEKHQSVFACDGWDLLGDYQFSISEDINASAVIGSVKSTFAAWGSVANVLPFLKAWDTVIDLGRYWQYSWTVKVDPDTAFLPQRLRWHLNGKPSDRPSWIRNWAGSFGLLGAIEVLSSLAVQEFGKRKSVCIGDGKWLGDAGEDGFMGDCIGVKLKMTGVQDLELMTGSQGDVGLCFWKQSPAIHPYKDPDAMSQCLDAMAKAR